MKIAYQMNTKIYSQIIQELKKYSQKPKMVVVTKYSDLKEINNAIEQGVTRIGENRVEVAHAKFPFLPASVEKHFIGVLQTKKLRGIIELFDVIESVATLKQLQKVEFLGKEMNKKVTIFLQFNISHEVQKSGFLQDDIDAITETAKKLVFTEIKGVMGMAGQGSRADIRQDFQSAKKIFDTLKKEIPTINELSLGMSNDYQIALEEGATIVRIGSLLFQKD